MISDFLKPFLVQLTDKKIKLYVRQIGPIPDSMCIDTRLYQCILF